VFTRGVYAGCIFFVGSVSRLGVGMFGWRSVNSSDEGSGEGSGEDDAGYSVEVHTAVAVCVVVAFAGIVTGMTQTRGTFRGNTRHDTFIYMMCERAVTFWAGCINLIVLLMLGLTLAMSSTLYNVDMWDLGRVTATTRFFKSPPCSLADCTCALATADDPATTTAFAEPGSRSAGTDGTTGIVATTGTVGTTGTAGTADLPWYATVAAPATSMFEDNCSAAVAESRQVTRCVNWDQCCVHDVAACTCMPAAVGAPVVCVCPICLAPQMCRVKCAGVQAVMLLEFRRSGVATPVVVAVNKTSTCTADRLAECMWELEQQWPPGFYWNSRGTQTLVPASGLQAQDVGVVVMSTLFAAGLLVQGSFLVAWFRRRAAVLARNNHSTTADCIPLEQRVALCACV